MSSFILQDHENTCSESLVSTTIPNSPTVSSPELLMSEINFALGLPFQGRTSSKKTSKPSVSIVKISNENSNNILKIETNSQRGSLSARAYDVLNALLHLAARQLAEKGCYNQEDFRVYYSNSEICEILKLNKRTMQGKVGNAILELADMRLNMSGHMFNTDTKEVRNLNSNFSLVQKIHSSNLSTVKNLAGVSSKYIVFDRFIIDLLNKGFEVNMKDYLSLKPGKERRTYFFIYAKKGLFGNAFSFDMNELSSVIGDLDKRPDLKKKSAEDVLKNIESKVPGISFCSQSQYGTGTTEILVEFSNEEDGANKYSDPFFGELVNFYSQSVLDANDFTERDYLQLKKQINKKSNSEFYNFFGKEILISEFAIDLALFQIIVTGYSKIGISKLAQIVLSKILDDSVEFPEGYKSFVVDRNSEKREKEAQQKIKIEIERRKDRERKNKEIESENFKKYFECYIRPQEKYYKAYEDIAVKKLEAEEVEENMDEGLKDIFYKARLNNLTYEIAKDDYYSQGKIFQKYSVFSAREIRSDDMTGYISTNNENPLLV